MSEDIFALFEEYNQVESEQEARLRQLFALLKKRRFNRFITFSSGDQWINCWKSPDRLDGELYINRMTRRIKAYDLGSDPA